MKIVHPVLSKPIELLENKTAVLIIENQRLYANMIFELISQLDGNDVSFVLSRNNAMVNIAKEAELIIDPFNMDINQRKIITKLHNMLCTIATGEDNYTKTMQIISTVQQYIEDIMIAVDYPLEYAQTIDASLIFKIADVKITDNSDSLAEKIIDYITIMIDLFKVSCFIFVNIKSFVTDIELVELYQHFAYKKINVLLIENFMREERHDEEIIRIIDKDMCEIY